MANEEVLGPRKTMFVLVIVVGCFAVLWPRILSPMVLGGSRDSLKPNQFDRDAGCCEVIFEPEVHVLAVLNEVCNYAVGKDGKLSPYAAAECRKSVNETCGVDIAGFLKRTENVGKTTKMLLDTMKSSNSSCLKEYFGVPVVSYSAHNGFNSWTLTDTVKQERPPLRAGPHPALRERGRAIPPGGPAPAPRPAPLPPHVRVRSSPLAVYFELDIKPPPIPGMRPPLGGAGGPVQAPKSSMGFVMPIYTICIIVFFVYTLSKLLFKRTGTVPYEHIPPDNQFRRRVFRDDSRTSPDKLVVTAISGLVAEVQQQMEASYAQNQQRQEVQDNHNHARPYTNGTVIHSGPVQIVASQYRDASKERSLEPQKEHSPELVLDSKESSPEPKEQKEATPEPEEPSPEPREVTPEPKESTPEPKEPNDITFESLLEQVESTPKTKELMREIEDLTFEPKESNPEPNELTSVAKDSKAEHETREHVPDRETEIDPTEELLKLTQKVEEKTDSLAKLTNEFLDVEKNRILITPEKQSTPDLLEEALKEDSPVKEESEEGEVDGDLENSSVKQPAPEEVKSIFLETEIPQQSRVLVADFDDHTDPPPVTHSRHSPAVVSGKMTLSLIQDAPRDTPERDLESTFDDFTTASAMTQPAAQKEDDLSDNEEIEEEIEIEEIEEEVTDEEEEEEKEEPKREQRTEANGGV